MVNTTENKMGSDLITVRAKFSKKQNAAIGNFNESIARIGVTCPIIALQHAKHLVRELESITAQFEKASGIHASGKLFNL